MGHTRTASATALSPGQARFALEREAHGGVRTGDGMVFMYHNEPWGTYRWLADAAGHTVASEAFRKTAAT